MRWFLILLLAATRLLPDAPALRRLPSSGPWKDEQGQATVLTRFDGTPLVVTAFYTGCEFRCPPTIRKLKAIEAAFKTEGRPVNFLLVTLDPKGDTPAHLRAYKRRENMGDNWHFAIAPRRELLAFTREYMGWAPIYDMGHISHEITFLAVGDDGLIRHAFQDWTFQPETMVKLLAPGTAQAAAR